jgi:hypothetical protein
MYIVVCKETDEIHVERVPADPVEGARLLAKAERVIDAQHPPARISEDPEFWLCRLCEHRAVCRGQAAAERTCRSCLHATPVEGGWHCGRWSWRPNAVEQRAGCPQHLYIPDLVPGEVADAGDDWVAYRMADGSIWRDTGRYAA